MPELWSINGKLLKKNGEKENYFIFYLVMQFRYQTYMHVRGYTYGMGYLQL